MTGAAGGRTRATTGTLLAQGTEITLTVPGAERVTATWRISLPENIGFTAAHSTEDGVDITLTGHQVALGNSRFSR
ncbi:hypothetical protein ACFWXK_31890 [Streptomyces sp. NPDC059070]|uniref:hypothetical protein n=1 Tax=Streptomyces sp. NPDC059070 TaxID=3346713 RepID=UPI0036934DCE